MDGHDEDWLLLFKNETHNHPTEIEPFGGAATCIGGAIRDPLSGRGYVYQAMRVTGAADPTRARRGHACPASCRSASMTTTARRRLFLLWQPDRPGDRHWWTKSIIRGYVGQAHGDRRGRGRGSGGKRASVRRPMPGDVVMLLGGRTGRDGCGGATGSSKAHSRTSLETCGAEVQKGNAPEERKLQRLLRDPRRVTKLIKRCNDFGAGGVSVAIGELAEGLEIDLNAVPRKYDGLSGTELAISESQERMAVVLREGGR